MPIVVIVAVAFAGLLFPGPGLLVTQGPSDDVAVDVPAESPTREAPVSSAASSDTARPVPTIAVTAATGPGPSEAEPSGVEPSEVEPSEVEPSGVEPSGGRLLEAEPSEAESSPGEDEPAMSSGDVGETAERSPGPPTSVPVELHERVVREKRELESRVAALEAETTALESEMLALDLQLVVLDTATRDSAGALEGVAGEPDAGTASPPIELGNTTLVPVPLPSLDEGGAARVGTAAGAVDATASSAPEPSFAPTPPPEGTPPFDEPFLPGSTLAGGTTAATAAVPSSASFSENEGGGGRAQASADVGGPVERVVVVEVPYGSGADDAGLLPGDILLAIDDVPVASLADVDAYAVSDDPAPLHELELLRGDRRRWVTLAGSPARLSLVTRLVDPARLSID